MALGIVYHSWWKRWKGRFADEAFPPFTDTLQLLDHCKKLGAAGLQISVDKWTDDFALQVRRHAETLGLFLEGSVTPPSREDEVPHFADTLRRAKDAGVTILRSAIGGRRYELYTRHDEFLDFKKTAIRSLELTAPVAEKAGVRIGVENHKDFHAAELADILHSLSSPAIGACIDNGNNIALLEEPMSVVEVLAPFAVTCHLKDMAVQPSPDGFFLAEVPLGEGMLDLQSMVDTLKAANPQIRLNLEMITRDPLSIPCLTPSYWPTFPDKLATELATALGSVQHYAAPELTVVSKLPLPEALKLEDDNIVSCLKYAKDHLL
jgi:sugar phosphate isomerase/epimerase